MRQWFCKLHWVTRLQAPNPFDLFQGTSSLRSSKFLTVMAKRCLCPVTVSHSAPLPLTGNRLHRGPSTTLYLPTLRQEGPTFSELPSAVWMTTHGKEHSAVTYGDFVFFFFVFCSSGAGKETHGLTAARQVLHHWDIPSDLIVVFKFVDFIIETLLWQTASTDFTSKLSPSAEAR